MSNFDPDRTFMQKRPQNIPKTTLKRPKNDPKTMQNLRVVTVVFGSFFQFF